jgi:hypothetical protein
LALLWAFLELNLLDFEPAFVRPLGEERAAHAGDTTAA